MINQTKYIPDNLIVYHGPSAYDGSPIVAVLQRGSNNSKTGAMAQLFILSADTDPITASRIGADFAVCGKCKHRGNAAPDKPTGLADNRTCYVNLLHAPASKYKSFKAGKYKQASTIGEVQALLYGQGLRIGAYGDPAALPHGLCEMLAGMADYSTSYTHGHTVNPGMVDAVARYSMVSADTKQEAIKAHSKGYRTFRVIPVADWKDTGRDSMLSGEILCPASEEGRIRPSPASEEAGQRVTCSECRLCNGTASKAKSIAIVAHGASRAKVG